MNKSLNWSMCAVCVVCLCALFVGGLTFSLPRAKAAVTYANDFWTSKCASQDEGTETSWVGAGTTDNPYKITTAAQLAQLAYDINYKTIDGAAVNYAGKYFQLTTDIDLSGFYWVPIGNEERPFKGTLYGNNRKISNMYISANLMNGVPKTSAFCADLGLFGCVNDNDSIINNLTIEGALIEANENTVYAGFFAGNFDGKEIRQIKISDAVGTGTDVVSTIRYNIGSTAMQQNTYIGGVVGVLNGSYNGVLQTSSMPNYANAIYGNISSNATNPAGKNLYIGGLAGRNNSTIQNSARDGGEIQSYIGVIGGLVGSNNGKIDDSYNGGNVLIREMDESARLDANFNNDLIRDNSTWVGGLAGENRGTISATNAFGNTIFNGVESQNIAPVFQSNRGGIGGLVGLNRQGGTLTGLKNTALIKCVSLIDADSLSKLQYIGGIAAINGGTIKSCVNMGDINPDSTGDTSYYANAAGGIVAVNDLSGTGNQGLGTGDGLIIACQNYGKVATNMVAKYAGGIAAINASRASYSISSNETSNTIPVGAVLNLGLVRGQDYVGGIVGYNAGNIYGAANLAKIEGLYINNNSNTSNGGLVGYSIAGRVEQSFNKGEVYGGSIVGGLVGSIAGATTLLNCANYASVSGDMYIGGVVGEIEAGALDSVFSVGDVDSLNSVLTRAIGGVIGRADDNGGQSTPNSLIDLSKAFAYSSDIANYDSTDSANGYNNGMSVIGNFPSLHTNKVFTSYQMTLPGVSELSNQDIFKSFYMTDSTYNTNWYFEGKDADEENQLTYYYPILTLFKDTLGVFVKSNPTVAQTLYPTETIYTVNIYNYEPMFTGSTETRKETVKVGNTQYIVAGHKVIEPSTSEYTSFDNYPADVANSVYGGYTKHWKWKNIDEGTNTQLYDWDFGQSISANSDIVITWENNTYEIKYLMQNYDATTGIWGAPTEVTPTGLITSITYSLNPAALKDLILLSDDAGYSYEQGWWIFDYLPDSAAIDMAGSSRKNISLNTVYNPEDYVYLVCRRTPKPITVQLNAGQFKDQTIYYRGGSGNDTTKTTTIYYGTMYDLSNWTSLLNFNSDVMSFKGWYTASTGGIEMTGADSKSIFPLNVTDQPFILYAQWTGKFQDVEFFSIDERGVSHSIRTISVAFNTTTVAPTDLQRFAEAAGYEVDKFYTEDGLEEFDFSTVITDTTRIMVTWKKRVFNLILDANGGVFANGNSTFVVENVEYQTDIISRIIVQLGSGSSYTDYPTRVGHSRDAAFGAVPWISRDTGIDLQVAASNNNSTMPAYDYTIYMAWSVNRITITFDANGGVFTASDDSTSQTEITSFDYGSPLQNAVDSYLFKSDLTRNDGERNYKLLYWSFDRGEEAGEHGERIPATFTVPENGLTLYAIWAPQMTVTFKKLYSVGAWKVIEVNKGEKITAPDISDPDFPIAGYAFDGWFEVISVTNNTPKFADSPFDFNQPINESIMLCAVWKETDEKVETNMTNWLIWVLVAIGAIVVILFVVVLMHSRKKGMQVNNKHYQTESSKKKLQEIRDIESRKRNNPFDEDF